MYFTGWDCNKTHVRHSDLKGRCKPYGHRYSISHTADDALVHLFSLHRLPFLRCPVLHPSTCSPIPHPALPQNGKTPITSPKLSDTVALLSTFFEDALTSTNHSATMFMNELVLVLIVVDDEHIESPAPCFRQPGLFHRQRQTEPF